MIMPRLKDGHTMPDDNLQLRERLPAAVYDLALRLGVKPDASDQPSSSHKPDG